MPIYTYQCDCGLKFNSHKARSKHKKPSLCPACKMEAPRCMPSSVSGQFNHTVDGMGPQNTGIHDLDTNYDQVIGKSADQNREHHRLRTKLKKEIIKNNPGITGHDLSRNDDGSYRVLHNEEREAHKRALTIHTKATAALKKNPPQDK